MKKSSHLFLGVAAFLGCCLGACVSSGPVGPSSHTVFLDAAGLKKISRFHTKGGKIAGQGVFSEDGAYFAFPTQNLGAVFTQTKSDAYANMEVFRVSGGRLAYLIPTRDSEKYSGGYVNEDSPFVVLDGHLGFLEATRGVSTVSNDLDFDSGHSGMTVCVRRFEFETGEEREPRCLDEEVTKFTPSLSRWGISNDHRFMLFMMGYRRSARPEDEGAIDYHQGALLEYDLVSGRFVGQYNTERPETFVISSAMYFPESNERFLYTGMHKRYFEGPLANADEPILYDTGIANLRQGKLLVPTYDMNCGRRIIHLLDSTDTQIAFEVRPGDTPESCDLVPPGFYLMDWETVRENEGVSLKAEDISASLGDGRIGLFVGPSVFGMTVRHEDGDRFFDTTELIDVSGGQKGPVLASVPGRVVAAVNLGTKTRFAAIRDVGRSVEVTVYEVNNPS